MRLLYTVLSLLCLSLSVKAQQHATFNQDKYQDLLTMFKENDSIVVNLDPKFIIEASDDTEECQNLLRICAFSCVNMGHIDHAIYYMQTLLDYQDEKLGSIVTSDIISFANLWIERGDVPYAIDILMLLYDDYKSNNLSLEIREYCDILIAIASSMYGLSNYSEGLSYAMEAKSIYETIPLQNNTDSLNYAISLELLGSGYEYQDSLLNAMRYTQKAISILKNCRGETDHNYLICMENMASINAKMNNYKMAIHWMRRVVDIHRKRQVTEPLEYAHSLQSLANYHFKNGDITTERAGDIGFDEYLFSFEYDSLALDIREKHLAPSSQYLLTSYRRMAYISEFLSKYDLNEHYSHMFNINSKEYIKNNFAMMTSHERYAFWEEIMPWFSNLLPMFIKTFKQPQSLRESYDALLFSKGLLLQAEYDIYQIIKDTNDNDLFLLYNDIMSKKEIINQSNSQNNEKQITTYQKEIEQQERTLMSKLNINSNIFLENTPNWKDVQNALDENSIAIEFMHEQYGNGDSGYSALVLTPQSCFPKYVQLCTFTGNKLQDISYQELSDSIWGKLLIDIPDQCKIYFSAAGELHGLPIESIPHFSKNGLVSDYYNFYRLSSTKEIINTVTFTPLKGNVVLYGGLEYGISTQEMKELSLQYNKPHHATRALRPADRELEELKGTKDEALVIQSVIEQNTQLPIKLLIGKNGTEESFKDLDGTDLAILHIGTHGFMRCEDNLSKISFSNNMEDESLSHCGLYFTGAQNALNGTDTPEGVEDGILSALEVSILHFNSLEHVTLSACDTAQGDITGDGVFGLQRGFKKAGANSILMSLWKVDDEATCKLMTEFYSNWIGKKMTKHDALEAAKKTVRVTKGWEDPKYWAAFILLDGLD